MKHVLRRIAVLFLISGVVCIIVGLVICIWPEMSFSALTRLFALSIIVQGLTQFLYGTNRSMEHSWMIVLYLGIINIAAGHFIIFYPHFTETTFIISLGAIWMSTGIVMLLLVFRLYKHTRKDPWLIVSGIFSIVAGFYVLKNHHEGVLSLLWATALYDLLFGTLTVLFGIKARAWSRVYFDDIME